MVSLEFRTTISFPSTLRDRIPVPALEFDPKVFTRSGETYGMFQPSAQTLPTVVYHEGGPVRSQLSGDPWDLVDMGAWTFWGNLGT